MPGRKQRKPQRIPLSPERIADAALAFIDDKGLEALSMRVLGAELGVEGMALYKHFASKEALLDAVAEKVILELTVPAPSKEGWRARAEKVASDYRAIARRHPRSWPLVAMRRFNTPRTLALLDRIFFGLMADGLSAAQAVEVYRCVANFCNGAFLDELAERNFAESGLERLTPGPELTALIAAQGQLTPSRFEGSFKAGLGALLDGLEARYSRSK